MRATTVLFGLAILSGCDALWLDPMKLQPKYLPYAPSHFFADGAAMREPPAGTVSREALVGSSELTHGWIRDADGGFVGDFVERIPLKVDAALLANGRRHFEITCAACHGPLGDGVSVVASKMSLRPPPSLLTDRIRTLPDGRLFEVISEGYGLMPAYADILPVRERWGIVAFMRALELSQRAPLALVPEAQRHQLEAKGR